MMTLIISQNWKNSKENIKILRDLKTLKMATKFHPYVMYAYLLFSLLTAIFQSSTSNHYYHLSFKGSNASMFSQIIFLFSVLVILFCILGLTNFVFLAHKFAIISSLNYQNQKLKDITETFFDKENHFDYQKLALDLFSIRREFIKVRDLDNRSKKLLNLILFSNHAFMFYNFIDNTYYSYASLFEFDIYKGALIFVMVFLLITSLYIQMYLADLLKYEVSKHKISNS